MMGIGPAEATIVMMLLAGFGLPLGVPPQPENPAMQYVAPANCVLYSSWSGMATPDGRSANQTEQLFAEPELQEFARSLDKSIGKLVAHYAHQSGDPKAELLARVAPLWTKTIITKASAVFATKLETDGKQLLFEGGLLVEAGDQAQNLADGLTQLMTTPQNQPEQVSIGAAKFVRFAAQKNGPLASEVMIGAAGPFVLVGFGPDSVAGMMDRVRAKQTPAWLTEIAKRLPVERRSSISYINTKAIVKSFLPLAGPDGARIASSLGLDQIGEMISVTGLDQEGMVSRGLVKIDGEAKGLLALVDTKGIQPAQVNFLPKDATFAAAFSFNTEQAYNLVGHLISENSPEAAQEFEGMAAQFREMFGLRLQEDVLASLGEVWTFSASPADGWLGMTATVEVRDQAKLDTVLKRVSAMLSDAPPGAPAPRIESTKFEGNTIQMVHIPGFPVRPSWCLTGSRLIVGITPQSIKAQLGARPEEVGLFDSPKVAAAFKGEARVLAVSYQDSAKVFETTYSYLTLLAPMMLEQMNAFNEDGRPQPPLPFDFSALPSSRSIHRHLRPSVSITLRTSDGLETESRQTFPTLNVGTAGPIAVALLLPAVQAAREAARRMESANNIKQQVLGLMNYHDTFLYLPAAYSTDKDKKPLLSWRVHILPFIEQRPLYDQFKLDEPWDSEHNKKLIEKMPKTYRSPNSSAKPGMTTYLGVGGPRGIMMKRDNPKAGAEGLTYAAITDGTANTLMIVEANDDAAVIWTKPEEFVPDAKDPTKNLLGVRPGGFLAGYCDGHVQLIMNQIDPKVLMYLFERDDGNAIPDF
jgi:hypothetical protein